MLGADCARLTTPMLPVPQADYPMDSSIHYATSAWEEIVLEQAGTIDRPKRRELASERLPLGIPVESALPVLSPL